MERLRDWTVLDSPHNPCPPELLARQVGMQVLHYGFDGIRYSGVIEVHEDAVENVDAFFSLAYQIKFPVDHVVPAGHPLYRWDDDRLMAGNATSGFNYRTIAGTDQVSQHALGAFDVNPIQNPYIRLVDGMPLVAPAGAVWRPGAAGTLHRQHPLVELMLDRGWEWGGDWPLESGRTDYQHFQRQISGG